MATGYIPTPEQFAHIVARRDYKTMIGLIDSGKVPVDYRKDSSQYTPLLIICNHYDHYDRTPCYQLGGHGYDFRAIKYLLEKGADPNARPYYPVTTQGPHVQFWTTPLALVLSRIDNGEACESALDIVKILLQKGANTNIRTSYINDGCLKYPGITKVNIDADIKKAINITDELFLTETITKYRHKICFPIVKELIRYGCKQNVKEYLLKERRQFDRIPQHSKNELAAIDKLLKLLDYGIARYEQDEQDEENAKKKLLEEIEKKKLADEKKMADEQKIVEEAKRHVREIKSNQINQINKAFADALVNPNQVVILVNIPNLHDDILASFKGTNGYIVNYNNDILEITV